MLIVIYRQVIRVYMTQ